MPHSEPRLDAVLPLTLRDCDRAQILLDTLEIFFPGLHTLHVVVPDAQRSEIETRLRFSRLAIRTETEILPELPFWRRLFKASVAYRRRPDGWYVQQLAKLAGPRYVGSDHYLTFDADVFCTRHMNSADFVRQGRSLCMRSDRGDEHADWYAWSARVLGRPRISRLNHGATPLLYATEAMGRLHAFLEARVATSARSIGHILSVSALANSWVGFLLRHLPWAEHTLYHGFLESEGLFDQYHIDGPAIGARALHDRSVWHPGQFGTWDPAAAFADDGPYFSLVQSWLGVRPAEIRGKLATVHPALSGR